MRESGFEEAVAAYRAAPEEWTREATPHWHGIAQANLARCLAILEQRRKSKARRDVALDRAQLQRQRRDNREARSVMSVNRITKQEKTFY